METNASYPNETTTDDYDYEYIPYEEQPDYLQAQRIWIYGSPVIIIGGTVGNLLSLLVMLRRSLRAHTTSLYLVVLAVVDTLALYTGLLRHWIRALSGVDVRSFSPGGWKVHIFLVYFLLQFEAWILVSVAVERLAAIFIPLRAKSVFTKKFATIQMLVTGIVIAGFNLHFFWTYKIIEEAFCYLSNEKHEHFVFDVWTWLDFCLASLVPFVLMFSSNLAIIGRLLYLRSLRAKNLNVKNDVKMTSMTAILLTINFVFFLTTAPIALYLSTQNRWLERLETWADVARLDLVWASLNMVAYLNNSVNFILYILSGPRFRREFLKMLHGQDQSSPPHDRTERDAQQRRNADSTPVHVANVENYCSETDISLNKT